MMSERQRLIDALRVKDEAHRAAAPARAADRVRKMQARVDRERQDRAKLQEVFRYCQQFSGVHVAGGHILNIRDVKDCWQLDVAQDDLDWVQVGVEHWPSHHGAIPRTLPLLLARWGKVDWETVSLSERKGWPTLGELQQEVFRLLANVGPEYIKAAITRSRGFKV